MKKAVICLMLFIISAALFADVDKPPQFAYSGTADERALLNNYNLLRFQDNHLKVALSYDSLPAEVPYALRILSTGPNKERQNITSAIPTAQVVGIELLYRVRSGRGQLILNAGNYATYGQRSFPVEAGSDEWKKATFADGRTRTLSSIGLALVPEEVPFLLEICGVEAVLENGKRVAVYAPDRDFVSFSTDGIPEPQGTSSSMQGRAIIGMGGGFASRPATMEIMKELQTLFSPLAIAPLFDFRSIASVRNEYLAIDLPISYQTTEVGEIGAWIGRHSAFGESASGFSRNHEPDRTKWRGGTGHHSGDFSHPALLEAHCRIIDALKKAGINDYIIPDAAWWEDASAGYTQTDIQAFRQSLNRLDGGLEWVDFDGTRRKIYFPEYFESRFGVALTPDSLGLKNFDEFMPPKKQRNRSASPEIRRNYAVFYALKRYILLRFFSQLGDYGNLHGVRVTAMPLNSSCYGQGMARLDGYQVPGFDFCDTNSFNTPESPAYGNPGELPAEAGIFGLLARGMGIQAARAQSRTALRLINETGQAGGQVPYRDPRLNYALLYALTAATGAESIQCDFLSSFTHRGLPTWQTLSDPAQKFHYSRLTDKVFSISAFLDAYAAGPRLDARQGSVLALQRSADFFALKNDDGIGKIAWQKLLFPVEFISPEMLKASFTSKARLILDDMHGHTPQQLESLSRFISEGGNRVLVLTALSAGHRFDGSDLLPAYFGEEETINAPDAYRMLGIEKLARDGVVDGVVKSFDERFSIPACIQASATVFKANTSGFETMAAISGKALVSRKTLPGNNQIYLLHYQPGSPETANLDLALISAIGNSGGIEPVAKGSGDVLVQPLELPLADGAQGYVYVVFDRRPYRDFVFQNGAPSWKNFQKYETGLPDSPVEIQMPFPHGICYELLSGVQKTCSNGTGELKLEGKSCRLFFLLPDTPAGNSFLDKLKERHHLLQRYLSAESIQFLQDNKE